MKLLIVTQKVDIDDPILGFFHRWIEEFAKHCEKITVICLEKGNYDLPENVMVYSLDKENGGNKLKYAFQFFNLSFFQSLDYDTVFVHMNPIYLVLAGWWWRLGGKKVALWYTHRQVDFKLRIAEKFAQIIFTASNESFLLPSPKVLVVGHGIDTEAFNCAEKPAGQELVILHVGRITRIKNCDILIKAGHELLGKTARPVKILFVGGAVTAEDLLYRQELDKLAKELGMGKLVEFKGNVSPRHIKEYYCQSSFSVNLTPTGGVDKAVLESMASETPVLSSNKTFAAYFGEYKEELLFKERDYKDLADKIANLLKKPEQLPAISRYLREQVIEAASLQKLIPEIIGRMNNL